MTFHRYLDSLEKALTVPLEHVVKIVSVKSMDDGVVLQDGVVRVELAVESNFPREFVCQNVLVSMETDTKENVKSGKTGEKYCKGRILSGVDLKPRDPMLEKLHFYRHLDVKQDKQLASASVVCKQPEFKRKDSSVAPPKSQFQNCLKADNLVSASLR